MEGNSFHGDFMVKLIYLFLRIALKVQGAFFQIYQIFSNNDKTSTKIQHLKKVMTCYALSPMHDNLFTKAFEKSGFHPETVSHFLRNFYPPRIWSEKIEQFA